MISFNRKKVFLLTNMISSYRIPLFNAISEKGNIFLKLLLLRKEKRTENVDYLKIRLNLIIRFYQDGIGLFEGKRKRLFSSE